MNCSISQIDQDDRLDTRIMCFQVDGKTIVTPAKTIESKGKDGEINEISLRVGFKEVHSAMNHSKNKLARLHELPNKEAVNIVLPDYTDLKFIRDGVNVLSTFESRIHSYSDVVVVPRWSGILQNKSGTLGDDLISMTQRFLDEAKVRNGKLVMGCIPMNIPDGIIDDLVSFYLKSGISSFVLDYCNCLPLPKKYLVRNIYKKIQDGGWEEDSILYSVNVRRTHKTRGIFPADDLLTFVHGVDLIGGLHIPMGSLRKESWYPEPKLKRFDSSQYTYNEVYGLNRTETERLKENNSLSQNLATVEIRKSIEENRSAYGVLSSKNGAKEYLVDSHQTSLFDLKFNF